jgi:hypothetical protein
LQRLFLQCGVLRRLEDVRAKVRVGVEEQTAALEHLRSFPHLRCLRLVRDWAGEAPFPLPPLHPAVAQGSFPPHSSCALESLLRELPSVLHESGASLETTEVEYRNELSAESGSALAQVLRSCSSTLTTVKLFGTAKTPDYQAPPPPYP